MPNEITVTLKGEGSGPASEWVVVHAETPEYLSGALDALAGDLGAKVADAGVAFRAVTAAKAGTSPAAQAQPPAAVATAYQPTPDPETQLPPAQSAAPANPWGQPAQAATGVQQYAQPAQAAPQAPAYAPVAQQPAQQQWAQPGAQPAAPAWNPPQPGPAPMGSDGFPMVWKVGQPTAEKQGYGAWMSGAPRNHPNRAKAQFVVNTPKLGG